MIYSISQKYSNALKHDVVELKDWDSRKYKHFVNNFYIMKGALRYFSVKKHISFTSSKIADNFPIPVTVAGSCLTILEQLDVVEVRTVSSSPDRYLAEKVDLEKLEKIEQLLIDNSEISRFKKEN